MNEEIKSKIVEIVSQSLMDYRRKGNYEDGEKMFAELFHNRRVNLQQIENTVSLRSNLIIMGNPGEGKSCLLHYMFDMAKKERDIFPIMLDYRDCYPRTKQALLKEFIIKMRAYFVDIGINDPLTSETTFSNFEDHFTVIQQTLSKTKEKLTKKKN